MDELYERDFKGVWIPKDIWTDTNLSILDKVIAVEIDSLDKGDKGCYASNKYFAEFCNCSESAISKSISKLIDYGLIYIEKFDGRQRTLRSRVSISASLPSKIYEADWQNMPDNNTSNNTFTKKKEVFTNVNTKKEKSDVDMWFAAFWKEYPKKADKKNAMKSFEKVCKTENDFETIMNGLTVQKNTTWKGKELQYVPLPTTWLNGKRWEDEPIQPVTHSSKGNLEDLPF